MWAALGVASGWFLFGIVVIVMAAALGLAIMGVHAGFRSGLAALHGQKPPRGATRVHILGVVKHEDDPKDRR